MVDELAQVAEDSARGGFFLISGTAIATVIMAVASILVAKFLGSELYGEYTLALVVPQLLFLFTDLGVNLGVTKYVANFKSRGETNRIAAIVKYALVFRSAAGLILFVANYVFADAFALFLQRPELSFYIRIASVSILFQVIFATATSVFVGLDKTEHNALTTNIQALAKTIISVTLVLLGLSVAGAVIGHTLSYAVAAVAGILVLHVILRRKPTSNIEYNIKNDLRDLMRYGAPLYASVLLIGLIPLYKNFVLALNTTNADIGNYKAAINFATLMTVLSIPITTALLPAFAKLSSATHEKLKMFFKFANKYVTMLVIPATILIVVYSGEIVQIIYGSEYELASSFLASYCLLYLLSGLGYLTLTSFYNGLGETTTTLKMSLITFLMLAILSPILGGIYYVQGVISSFLIASTIGTVYGSYKAKRKFRIEFDIISILKIYLISVASILLSLLLLYSKIIPALIESVTPPYLLSAFPVLPGLVDFGLGCLLCIFTYITLLPLTKTVTTSELQTVIHVSRKIKGLSIAVGPIVKYQRKLCGQNQRQSTHHTSTEGS
jgi:O-antigen/teichoic acid export membrane protein